MNRDNTGKYNADSSGHTYGRDYKGGWDIDTSDWTQRTLCKDWRFSIRGSRKRVWGK